MKRIVKMMTLLFVLVLVLSLNLIGCSSTSSSSKEKQEPKKVKTTETVKIKPEKISNNSKETTTSVTEKKNIVSKITSETNKQTESVSKQTVTAVQQKTATSSNSITTTEKSNQVPLKTVTLSITGPKDHRSVLSATKVSIKAGETILDVLLHATKNAGIQVDYDGSGATAYVNGIDNIYEFDYGAKSGWLFKQNGVSLTKSSGIVKIKAGDRIECYYTE